MSRIIDQVQLQCKRFERGCEISRKIKSRNTDVESLKRLHSSPRGRITGFSVASRRRLREYLASARPACIPATSGYFTMGVCLTIPNSLGNLDELQERHFSEVFRKSFRCWYNAIVKLHPLVGMIWRVELQKSRMPHVHLVAYLPFIDDWVDSSGKEFDGSKIVFENFFGRVSRKPFVIRWSNNGRPLSVPRFCADARRLWLKQLEKNNLKTEQSEVRSVDCRIIRSDCSVHYLCDHESKHKQDQLGWQGRQWGIINGSALAFVESAPVALSKHQQGLFSRCYARLQAQRLASLKPLSKAEFRRLVGSIRLRYSCDHVRASGASLFGLRVQSAGDFANAADKPTSETMRNYSRIDYRPLRVSVCSRFGGVMPLADFFELVHGDTFEAVRDPLLARHDALVARLSSPLVQGELALH